MSVARRVISLVLGASALSAILYAGRTLLSSRAIAVWIVLLAAIAFAELFRAARVADEPTARAALQFENALFPGRAVHRRPAELERVDRDIVLGAVADVWGRHGVVPRLRSVAAARLSGRCGIDLTRDAEVAREILGEEAWELVRPDWQGPADPYLQGVPLPQVEL